MKRHAFVWKDRRDGTWHVEPGRFEATHPYPTHADALHAALEAVGLTPTNPEPMETP